MINENPLQSSPPKLSVTLLLKYFSYLVRAVWFFFPGLLFVILGFFAFALMEQGRDLVAQSMTLPFIRKFFIILGLSFWSLLSWYTARILAYNDNDFYKNASVTITVMPRLIAYLVFTIVGIGFYVAQNDTSWPLLFIGSSVGLFVLICIVALNKQVQQRLPFVVQRPALITYMILTFGGLLLVWITWKESSREWTMWGILLTQVAALAWVSFRGEAFAASSGAWLKRLSIAQEEGKPDKRLSMRLVKNVYKYKLRKMQKDGKDPREFLQVEYYVFIGFNIVAFLAIIAYFVIVSFLECGRLVGSFAFVLLAFGILLGLGNLLTFASFRSKINWHLVLIFTILFMGLFIEPHAVRSLPAPNKNHYDQRPDLRTYLQWWVNAPERKALFNDPAIDSFPVYFVLADGGASRSGYWTAAVLSRFHESTRVDTHYFSQFSQHLLALAGASGGSVGNTTFMAALKAQGEHRQLRTDSLSTHFLRSDFLTYPLARLLGPELVNVLFFHAWGDRAAALEESMENPSVYDTARFENGVMKKIIAGNFLQFVTRDSTEVVQPILCINTTRMQDSKPAVVVNIQGDVFNPRMDVLNAMDCFKGIRVSSAMVLGARFPYFSPAGRIRDNYFVDGGYFDNSGAGPVTQIIYGIEALKAKLNEQGDTSLLRRALNKMSYYVLHLQNNPNKKNKFGKVQPAANDLAAPLITLMGSYGSQTNFNDLRLIDYLQKIDGVYHKINLYLPEGTEMYPMNWALSDSAVWRMNDRVRTCPEINQLLDSIKLNKTLKLRSPLRLLTLH